MTTAPEQIWHPSDEKNARYEEGQREFIRELIEHLDYCGWGDSWERECSEQLRERALEWQKANPAPPAPTTTAEETSR